MTSNTPAPTSTATATTTATASTAPITPTTSMAPSESTAPTTSTTATAITTATASTAPTAPVTLAITDTGWLTRVMRQPSPHCDARPAGQFPRLLVIHNISLPPGEFAGRWIDALFAGTLDISAHASFASLANLRVSAHCLIRRDGEIVQFVSFDQRAWHAGISCYQGCERCNDFSVGIELEGTDNLAYTDSQYQQLAAISRTLIRRYPAMAEHIVGHCDIAPGRKTDPGESFDWQRFHAMLAASATGGLFAGE